jgi:uncharacterized OB-fold protein
VSVGSAAIAPVREGLFTVDPPALLAGRCGACGTLRFPAAEICPACQSVGSETVALSGTGTVFTFTVVHASPPGYLGEAPYAYGIVELPEGLRVTATLLAGDLGELAIGDQCTFELMTLTDEQSETALLSYAYRVGA